MSVHAPAPNDVTVAAGAILGRLDKVTQLLRDLLLDSEQEPDFDVTYCMSFAAAGIIVIGPLPRTLKHVELSLTAWTTNFVAVVSGNMTLAQAQAAIGFPGGSLITGLTQASIVTGGGTSTVRDYLDGSGYITVLSNAAALVGLRVRALDATQQRPQRT